MRLIAVDDAHSDGYAAAMTLLIRALPSASSHLVELAESEARRLADDERFSFTARMYRDLLAENLHRFEHRYGQDIVGAFKLLQDAGLLEIVTSAATHAYLPAFDLTHARGQFAPASRPYRQHSQRPSGNLAAGVRLCTRPRPHRRRRGD